MAEQIQFTEGFLVRTTFLDAYAKYYSPEGSVVIEQLYPDNEDLYEFLEFLQDNDQYIVDSTVLLPTGQVIDARSLPTNAEG